MSWKSKKAANAAFFMSRVAYIRMYIAALNGIDFRDRLVAV